MADTGAMDSLKVHLHAKHCCPVRQGWVRCKIARELALDRATVLIYLEVADFKTTHPANRLVCICIQLPQGTDHASIWLIKLISTAANTTSSNAGNLLEQCRLPGSLTDNMG